MGQENTAHIEGLLYSEDPSKKILAVDELVNVGDDWSIDAICALLKDEDETVRARAAKGLKQLRSARSMTRLIEALGDDSPNVKSACSEALIELSNKAILPLIESIQKNDGRAATAVRTLGGAIRKGLSVKMEERAMVAIVSVLKHRDINVRRSAVNALATAGQPIAISALKDAYYHESTVEIKDRIRETIGSLGRA